MKRMAVATIVAKNYLSFARVLAQSFTKHHPEVPFFVLMADEIDGRFDPAAEPFKLLGLGDLSVPHPKQFCFSYTQQELSYACTPYLLEALLDRGFAAAAFLKQESLVLDDLAPVLTEMQRRPITLTPHLLKPLTGSDAAGRELNILQSGVFNVGFLGVTNTAEARRFLAWWQDRVYRHCRYDVAAGMHYEQRWLDLVPAFFAGAGFVRDPGFNLGHWNLPEREVHASASGFTAAGSRLRFMRFSGFEPEQDLAVTRYSARLKMEEIGEAQELFRRYANLLAEAGYAETGAWPFFYSRFDNGVPIPEVARQLYREMGAERDAFGDPFQAAGSASFFHWLLRPAGQQSAGSGAPGAAAADEYVSNLWQGVYERRPDVRATYPEPAGSDRAAFLDWAERFGMNEHGIPAAFHPLGARRRD